MKHKPPTQDISRKEAAKLLDDVMMVLAKFDHDEAPDAERFYLNLVRLFETAGLKLPKPCTGEAHTATLSSTTAGAACPTGSG